MSWVRILLIAMRLALGGIMIYGGIDKFARPIPRPLEVVEKAAGFAEKGQEETLQKVLYISGAKQTGYFWEVLGICEVLFGLLLVMQYPAFVGAVLLLPITFHIFLFHLFLEPDELGELVKVTALLLINLVLVASHYPRWRNLLWISP